MNRPSLAGGLAALTISTFAQPVLAAPSAVCWVEYGGGAAPGALGGEGATAPIWRNTASGLLVRHPKGDVLIDAGWSAAAADEVKEFAPAKAAVAGRVLGALSWRVPAPQALARVGETPDRLAAILPTHAHFDHMAGAADLPGAPVLLSEAELQWVGQEKLKPDVVPASNIQALEARLKPFRFQPKPFMGFASSYDLHGDGAIVAVPLPGHTPGGIGVFVTAGGRTWFHTGDATFTLEALEKGLPKMKMLRDYADNDPPATDAQVRTLAAFHKAHPEVAILPSHDRTAWEQAFGPSPTCVP